MSGPDGAEAGAELGASADPDAPTPRSWPPACSTPCPTEPALVLAIELLWPSRCDAVLTPEASWSPIVHSPEDLIAFAAGLDLGDEAELEGQLATDDAQQ